jgi:phage terminase large subunit
MQNSIRDSVLKLLSDQIYALKLEQYFIIQKDGIYGRFGSEFIFKGLKHNIAGIRSTEGIDIAWCEEAELVSDDSWMLLIPTLFRKPDCELLISYNPETDGSATDLRFCKNVPPSCAWAEVNFEDNPFFPEGLKELQEYDKRIDPEKWEHVWHGKYKKYSEALIFKGKIKIEPFESPTEDVQFYYGADFGFSQDPSVLVRMFIRDRNLYVDKEAYGVGVEITDLHQFFSSVPGTDKWRIIADSQRPDTISFLSQHFKAPNSVDYPGFTIQGAEKGKGSVEDGISFLRGFESIIIHPDCKGSASDFSNYRWKTDKLTGEILPVPQPGSDHSPDAVRYALEPFIKNHVSVFELDYRSIAKSPLGQMLGMGR